MFAFYSTINAQEVKAKRLKTNKTQEHVNVSGTNLFLKIPEGFEKSVTCSGWNNKTGSSIVISKRTKSLTDASDEIDQRLISSGYDIKSEQKKQVLLNGDEAIYFEIKNGTKEKVFLLIKVNNITFIVEGFCGESVKKNKSVKKAVLSAFIEKLN